MTKNSGTFKPGKEHRNWKGGSYVDDNGYRRVMVDGVYVKEHIYVAEKQIGRKLLKNEVAHHRDEDRLNNDPENIEVMTRSAHSRHHATGRKASEKTIQKLKEAKAGENQKEEHQQWRTDVTKERIEILLNKGLKKKEIAKELNIDPDTLRARLKHYGLYVRGQNERK